MPLQCSKDSCSKLNPPSGPDFASVYLDDILVFSRTLEEHLAHLQIVIHRMKDVGLKLKCRFVKRELEYLGHIVSRDELKTNPRLITAVQDWDSRPTTKDSSAIMPVLPAPYIN